VALALSVVVPTRDTRALTLACLRSLVAELPRDAEVVVVDDDSRDGTDAAIARELPAVRVVALTPPRGFTAAANVGLAAVRGDVRWLLNSDTEVGRGAVAALLAAFAATPRLGIAGAALFFPDGRPQWSGGARPTPRWLFALASGAATLAGRVPGYRRWRPVAGHASASPAPGTTTPVDWIPGAAFAVRAEAWRAVGPFDESLRLYAQDLDLCLRARAAGFDVAVVPGARVLHHGGATIARLAGATTVGQEPAELWADLVRVVAKREGRADAARAVRVLRAGAALRIAARTIALPAIAAGRRAAWRRDTAAYVRARAALTALS
jgi:GT2 family glycosyltransferase